MSCVWQFRREKKIKVNAKEGQTKLPTQLNIICLFVWKERKQNPDCMHSYDPQDRK